MDGSENVRTGIFDKMKKFASGSLDAYRISSNQTRVSVVTFGDTNRIDLLNGVSNAAVQMAILNANQVGGRRDLSKTISFVQEAIFGKQNRPKAGKILVMIVARSRQQDSKQNQLESSLKYLTKSDINLVIITIGGVTQSKKLAKSIKDNGLINVASADRIKEAISPVVDAIGKAAGILIKHNYILYFIFQETIHIFNHVYVHFHIWVTIKEPW